MLVASRDVHGFDSTRPGIGGTAAEVPVARTTAAVAWSDVVVPSSARTSTVRSPVSRPWPRIGTMPVSTTHFS
jgi:hypothetical protein